MKQPSFLRKKSVILSALVLALGGAVYLNYWFGGWGEEQLLPTDAAAPLPENLSVDPKIYGEAALVSTEPSSYFSEASLKRQKSRDESIQTVKSVLEQVDVSSEAAVQATEKIVKLTENSAKEDEMESLIRAKGFENCMVYLTDDAVSVVVQTEGLTAEQAAQIKSVILANEPVSAACISITEIAANPTEEQPS